VRGVAPAPTLAVVVESGPSGTRVVTPPFGGVVSPQAAANQATSSTPALAHRCARLIRPALLIGHDVFIAASIRSPAPRPQCHDGTIVGVQGQVPLSKLRVHRQNSRLVLATMSRRYPLVAPARAPTASAPNAIIGAVSTHDWNVSTACQ